MRGFRDAKNAQKYVCCRGSALDVVAGAYSTSLDTHVGLYAFLSSGSSHSLLAGGTLTVFP